MTLLLEAPTLPLRLDENGVIRVGDTRIPIERVVYAFQYLPIGRAIEDIEILIMIGEPNDFENQVLYIPL